MAAFLSASDENAGKDHRSMFFYGGLVAPVKDWWEVFTPLWEERVLEGPPKICNLHMTDIRSKAWREKHGLSEEQAERRVDEALLVFDSVPSLRPISSRMNAGKFFDTFNKKKMLKIRSGAAKHFPPDYIAFIAYVITVLAHVAENCPDAEKVDFLIEKKGEITDHIKEFFDDIQTILPEFGERNLSELVGELIPGGKERSPLQMADVFCWHAYRRECGTLTETDSRRYSKFSSRDGERQEWEDGMIEKLRIATGGDAI